MMELDARMVTKKHRLHLHPTNLGLFGRHFFLSQKETRRHVSYYDGLSTQHAVCLVSDFTNVFVYILQISLMTISIENRFSYLLFKITALLRSNTLPPHSTTIPSPICSVEVNGFQCICRDVQLSPQLIQNIVITPPKHCTHQHSLLIST